jgi:hypothetical protein
VDVKQLMAVFFIATTLESFEFPTLEEIRGVTTYGAVPSFYHSHTAIEHNSDMNVRQASATPDIKTVIPLFVKEWNDGAQKGSQRSTDISFEMKTLTFLTFKRRCDVIYYQFVISLVGTKKSNHRSAEAYHQAALKELHSPTQFYSGFHKRNAYFCTRVAAGIRDRPARESLVGLPLQNSLFGQCFGHSVGLLKV